MPKLVINIAGPGNLVWNPDKNKYEPSIAGHMWFEHSGGSAGYNSDGFTDQDSNNYVEGYLSNEIEITQAQMDALQSFADKDNPPPGFGEGDYNVFHNSCVDYFWAAMEHAGLNPNGFEGNMFPGNNADNVSSLENMINSPSSTLPETIASLTNPLYAAMSAFGAAYPQGLDYLTNLADNFADKIKNFLRPPRPPVPPEPTGPLSLDFNGNGTHDPSDGLLALDLNQSGYIDGGFELFGDETILSNGHVASNAFEALAEYDSNHDGKINAKDSIFSSLLVWQDINSNGISEEGELHSLSELNISSISVDPEANYFVYENKLEHDQHSVFAHSDSSADIVYDPGNAIPANVHNGQGITVSKDIAALPDAVGYGNVYSLHHAMSLDHTGKLRVLIQAFVTEKDATKRKAMVGDILAVWTGKENVYPYSSGPYMNGRHLAILEAFWGQASPQQRPDRRYAKILEDVYQKLEQSIYSQLMAGSHVSQWFDMVHFYPILDTLNGNFYKVAKHFADRFGRGDTMASSDLSDFIETIQGINPYTPNVAYRDLLAFLTQEAMALADGARDVMLGVVQNGHPHVFDDEELTGTKANDVIKGYAGNDEITGQGGNDVLYGGDGDDELYGGEGDDRLYGGLYDGDGDNMLYGGAGDDYLSGGDGHDQLYGGDGRDQLYGYEGDDTLYGGTGNDFLSGGKGNDTYIYGLGDGYDVIYDERASSSERNVLRFLEGIAPEDISLTLHENIYDDTYDLLITIQSTGESIKIRDHFLQYPYALDAIEFADGTVWDVGTMKDLTLIVKGVDGDDDHLHGYGGSNIMYGGTGNDHLDGGKGDDILQGEVGNDTLNGHAGNDTLQGGVGDDRLYGGSGSDTYLYGLGDGNDTIANDSYDGSVVSEDDYDVLRFLAGIDPEDVKVTYDSNDLVLTIKGTGETIRVQSYFSDSATTPHALNAIEFADGTVWDVGTVMGMFQVSSDDDDLILGDTGDNTLHAGKGDDEVYGGRGDDVLYGDEGDDVLYGDQGHDILYGGEGDDKLYGGMGDDVLRGGTGDDILRGGTGNDVYVVGLGDGHDIIAYSAVNTGQDYKTGYGHDTLRFLEGITLDDIKATILPGGFYSGPFIPTFYPPSTFPRPDHLLLTVQGTGESIKIEEFFGFHGHDPDHIIGVQTVEFADGTVIDINALLLRSTEHDDNLFGSREDDVIYGLGGDDTIYGLGGNDTLYGGEGRDHLYGGDGDDILRAGPGGGDLEGGEGKDTYLYGIGDGHVYIENKARSNGHDVLCFLEGIKPSDIKVERDSRYSRTTLKLTLKSTGDVISVYGYFPSIDPTPIIVPTYGIPPEPQPLQAIEFADGTIWDVDTVRLLALQNSGSDNDDRIDGFDESDDVLYGFGGNDLIGGEGGHDTLYGGSGDDRLYGEEGDDTLIGGSGDDYLNGGTGSDTYLYGLGDGNDVIRNHNHDGDHDVLRFLEGINPDDVRARRDDDDLCFTIQSTGETIKVEQYFSDSPYSSYTLDAIEFADGTTWDLDTIKNMVQQNDNRSFVPAIQQTPELDRLNLHELWSFADSDVKQPTQPITSPASLHVEQQVERLITAMATFDVLDGVGQVSPQDVREQVQPILVETWG